MLFTSSKAVTQQLLIFRESSRLSSSEVAWTNFKAQLPTSISLSPYNICSRHTDPIV